MFCLVVAFDTCCATHTQRSWGIMHRASGSNQPTSCYRHPQGAAVPYSMTGLLVKRKKKRGSEARCWERVVRRAPWKVAVSHAGFSFVNKSLQQNAIQRVTVFLYTSPPLWSKHRANRRQQATLIACPLHTTVQSWNHCNYQKVQLVTQCTSASSLIGRLRDTLVAWAELNAQRKKSDKRRSREIEEELEVCSKSIIARI